MPAIVAVDQGTTGSTVLVFDRRGRVVGRAYSEFTQHYPRPGWVEHDPEEIWRVTLRVLRQACRRARVRARDIVALGITNQRETTILWDRRTGKPVHRAIVWQDRRTAPYCDELRARGAEDLVRRKTGLLLDPYFSGTKLRWLLEHVPRAAARAARGELAFGTVDSWLIWKLTGGAVHATDPTNASRTLLYDIRRGAWDAELGALLGVPAAILPEVRPSSGDFGRTVPDVLGAPIPIAGVAGDQQAALFGQGCVEPGMAKNTYGTGCFLLLNTGAEPVASRHGLVTTVACDARGGRAYALEGSIFIAGAAIQWLRDGLGLVAKAAESERLAKSVDGTLGVYLVPAFVGLGAPHWDAGARGALLGVTRGVTRAHVVRAALESLAYQTRDVADAMAADAGAPLRALRVDGGAAANDFLMQFQADVLGVPVDRPKVVETTAMGAAFLAGLATGFWRSQGELARARQIDRRFRPRMKPAARDMLYQGWRAAVARVRSRPPGEMAAPSALDRLRGLYLGHFLTAALYAAARLDIADALVAGPRTAEELAEAAGANADALRRLLRALVAHGVFVERADGRFEQNEASSFLRADVPGTMRPFVLLFGGPVWRPLGEMVDAIRTGENAFAKVHGAEIFEHLAKDPEQARNFNRAMTQGSALVAPEIVRAYDFSRFPTIVDVGGGQGHLLSAILAAVPRARGVLLDLPHVIAEARTLLAERGVADRCTLVEGSFFDAVPAGGDAYLMKWILHDWDDAACGRILANVRAVIPGHGRLVVVDRIMPERVVDGDPRLGFATLMDLNMLVNLTGRERTGAEFRSLFGAHGFTLASATETASGLGIVEGVPS